MHAARQRRRGAQGAARLLLVKRVDDRRGGAVDVEPHAVVRADHELVRARVQVHIRGEARAERVRLDRRVGRAGAPVELNVRRLGGIGGSPRDGIVVEELRLPDRAALSGGGVRRCAEQAAPGHSQRDQQRQNGAFHRYDSFSISSLKQ